MGINLSNFLLSKSKNKRMLEYQDLDHIDGVSISTVCANLYKNVRDDLVMFYFRDGANYASVYTQSKIISENGLYLFISLDIAIPNIKTLLSKLGHDFDWYSPRILNEVAIISKRDLALR